MIKKAFVLFLAAFFAGFAGKVFAKTAYQYKYPVMRPFTASDTIIVFAPHPDDEVIGCGGIMQACLQNHGKVFVIYLTNGDHNELAFKLYSKRLILTPRDYRKFGELRRRESLNAARILGVPEKNHFFLGYPDYGTMQIWENHWNPKKPFENFLTRAKSVPYRNDVSYGASYAGGSIVRDLKTLLLKIKPTRIFVTGPADTNFDHRAYYNFVRLALLDLGGKIHPEFYTFIIHSKWWPYRNGPELYPPKVLTGPAYHWEVYPLTGDEMQNKKAALNCFRSELIGKKNWMYSFVRRNELFRRIPIQTLSAAKGEIAVPSKGEGEFSKTETLQRSKIYSVKISSSADSIALKMDFDENVVERAFNVEIFLFGWNRTVPFAGIAKLSVTTDAAGKIILRNGETLLSSDYGGIRSRQGHDNITFTVPKKLLGDPQYLFVGGESKYGGLVLDFYPWKIFKVAG